MIIISLSPLNQFFTYLFRSTFSHLALIKGISCSLLSTCHSLQRGSWIGRHSRWLLEFYSVNQFLIRTRGEERVKKYKKICGCHLWMAPWKEGRKEGGHFKNGTVFATLSLPAARSIYHTAVSLVQSKMCAL